MDILSMFKKLCVPKVARNADTVNETDVLENRVCAATIVVASGKIVAVHEEILPPDGFSEYHSFPAILPGLVDTHVHLNEPGRTSMEGFWTGTRGAISGGVTTIVDMPLNSNPPTTTIANLNAKIQAARSQSWCDVGFLGGIIPGNVKSLRPLVDAGVRGFKGFMIDSGIPEFPPVTYDDIRAAMIELAESPTMLMFHAEKYPAKIPPPVPSPVDPAFLRPREDISLPYIYDRFLITRPPVLEDEAIRTLIDLSKFAPKLPLHVAHVSTEEALPILRHAQKIGVNISAETCFHYLALSAEEIPQRDTRYKSEPPIRSKRNQNSLWAAMRTLQISSTPLRSGPITMVVSDHSPCSPAAKVLPSHIPPHPQHGDYHEQNFDEFDGDFFQAWGGISSVGLGLPILSTVMNGKGWDVDWALLHIATWSARNPAQLVGLGTSKGSIQVGHDADFCIFDPETEWTLKTEDLEYKHKMSPYVGKIMKGRVRGSFLRGMKIWDLEEGFLHAEPMGKLLLERRRPELESTTAAGDPMEKSGIVWDDKEADEQSQSLWSALWNSCLPQTSVRLP